MRSVNFAFSLVRMTAMLRYDPCVDHDIAICRQSGVNWHCCTGRLRTLSVCDVCRTDAVVIESSTPTLIFVDTYMDTNGSGVHIEVVVRPQNPVITSDHLSEIPRLPFLPSGVLRIVLEYANTYALTVASLKELLVRTYLHPKPHPKLYGTTSNDSIDIDNNRLYVHWGMTEVE